MDAHTLKVSFIGNAFEPHNRIEVMCDHAGGRVSLADLIPGVEYIDPYYAGVWRNGVPVREELDEHLTVHAAPSDWFVVVRRPGLPAGTPALVVFLFHAAVSIIASVILSHLLRPPDRTQDKVDEGPTYGFDGISTQRGEGRPKQVVYGRIRAGGTLISEVIDNTHNAWGASTYRAQLAYGEGPIYAIAGITSDTPDDEPLESGEPGREIPYDIEIEGNPASALSDVKAYVRLGSLEQTYAPTFNFSELRTNLGTPLYAPADAASNGYTPLITLNVTSQADQNSLLAEYAVSTDLSEEADSVRVTLRFPSGYFQTSGTATVGRWWSCFIRYIKLDGAGTPIAVGGDFSDGWVRRQMPIQALASASPFSIEYHVPLLNPVGYTAVPLGYAFEGVWQVGGVDRESVISSPALPASWSGATTMPDFTFSTWARLTDLTESGVHIELFRHGDAKPAGTTFLRGVRFGFEERTYDTAPGYQVTRIVPQAEFFDGTGTNELRIFEGKGESYHSPSWWASDGVQTVHHFALTHKADIGDGRSRFRIYVDGEMLVEWLQVWSAAFPTSDPIYLATYTHLPTVTGQCGVTLDETWYYAEERSIDSIFSEYNNGAGMVGSTNPISDPSQFQILDPNKLVCGFRFNEGTGAGTTAQDFGNLNNDLVCSAFATLSGAFIVERRASGNSVERGKYRIEVMRNMPDSTSTTTFDDEVELEAVSGITDARFTYPGTPVLSISVNAQEQLGTNVPEITSVVSGRILPQWLGGDPTNPDFSSAWSRNPAWVALDMLTNQRYGLGHVFGPKNVDVLSFLEWALYCDEPIYDLRDSYLVGKAGAAAGYDDMLYNSSVSGETQFDGRGRISVRVPGSLMQTVEWAVGGFLGFVGEYEVPGFVAWTQAHAGGGGYEIERMTWTGSEWDVWLYYDRLSEGDPWTDGGYLSSEAGFPAGGHLGTAEGRIKRHTYDAVHDTAESSWENVQQVASVGRAVILLEGNRVRAKVNKPRSPVGLVSIGNMVEESFEVDYGGPEERENAYTIDFLDEEANWERRPAYVEHSSIQESGNLDEIRHDAIFVRGITRRAAALRHGQFLLNINQNINRSGKFKASVDSIHYEVGDVIVLQHDVLAWGQGGRCYSTAATTAQIVVDREVVLEAATTYYADVIDANSGAISTATVTSVAGTYDKGSTITLSGAGFDFKAQIGQAFVIYSAAERLLIEIVNLDLSEKLEVAVQWVEYDESIYDDVTEDIDTLASTYVGTGKSDRHLPGQVVVESVAAQIALGSAGSDEVRLTSGWRPPNDARDRGGRLAVWTRLATNGNDQIDVWRLRAEEPIDKGRSSFVLSDARIGDSYDLAFQTISPGGQRRAPERSPHHRVYVGSDAFRADPPTSFSATISADKVTYRIEPAENATGCFHEIRRGGWILGQVVAVLPPGRVESEPTLNWANGAANAAGRSTPTLYCRSMTPSGRYSSEATALVYDVVPSFGMPIRETGGGLPFYKDQSWEDFGNGWYTGGGAAPDTTLTDLQIVSSSTSPTGDVLPSAKYVTFTGTALTGSFQTAHDWVSPAGSTWKPEWYHIEFFFEAYQVHPTPMMHNTGSINAWSARRMIAEGPLDLLPGETPNVTATVYIKAIEEPDGTWSDWQEFVPGNYFGAMFYFKIVFVRPDSTYDIVMHRCHQRIRRVNRVRWERSPANRILTQGVMV